MPRAPDRPLAPHVRAAIAAAAQPKMPEGTSGRPVAAHVKAAIAATAQPRGAQPNVPAAVHRGSQRAAHVQAAIAAGAHPGRAAGLGPPGVPAVAQPSLSGAAAGLVGGLVVAGIGAFFAPAVVGIGTAVALGAVGAAGGYLGGSATGGGPAAPPAVVPAPPRASVLESEDALNRLQTRSGGTSEGTLALFRLAGSSYYAIEQETNTRVYEAVGGYGITYIPQKRLSGFHAEMRFVRYCQDNHLILRGATVWVSKPICQDCEDRLALEGVTMRSSRSGMRYYGWVDPDTREVRTEVDRPVGTYRGHRSETERLGADFSGSSYWG